METSLVLYICLLADRFIIMGTGYAHAVAVTDWLTAKKAAAIESEDTDDENDHLSSLFFISRKSFMFNVRIHELLRTSLVCGWTRAGELWVFSLGPRNTAGALQPLRDYTVRGQSNVWRLPRYWPPTPSLPGECVPPAFGAGEDTLAGWRMEMGWRVNILEDAGHCSVLYIRKYFVPSAHTWLFYTSHKRPV